MRQLARLGIQGEVQEAFVLRPDGPLVGGFVRNIVARVPGRGGVDGVGGGPAGDKEAILCLAHYDSVGAGPGVSDDLAGVAAWLEVLRALGSSRERLRRDLVVCFSDGEEQGLLGAEAFASQHPFARDVGAVINLEARGTNGPSRMFETGADNDWVAAAFAREARRPSTTSLATEVYRRMPNDTDFTVFRRRGIPGLNFAWIGGVARYHTPLDDLSHLSVRSLQHHVTNALDAVRALDTATWRERGRDGGDAVFLDLFGATVLLLREGPARGLALAALLAALVGVVRAARAGAVRPMNVLVAALLGSLFLGLVAFSVHGAAVLDAALAGVERPWRAHPMPALVGFCGAALLATVVLAPLVTRLVGRTGAALGAAVWCTACHFYLALFATGAAALLVVPAVLLALGALLARYRGDSHASGERIALTATVGATAVLVPLGSALLDAFGLASPAVPAPPLGLVLGALLGLLGLFAIPVIAAASGSARFALGTIGGVAVGFGAVLAHFLPAVSAEVPGHANVVYVAQADPPAAEWQVLTGGDPLAEGHVTEGGRVTRELPMATQAGAYVEATFAAPPGALPFAVLADESVAVTEEGPLWSGRLVSPAGADEVDVEALGVVWLEVEGARAGSWVRIVGKGQGGVRLRALLTADSPTLRVRERVLRPSPDAERVPWKRPAELVPRGRGDMAELHSLLRLRTPNER
jgi:hypothetical protein